MKDPLKSILLVGGAFLFTLGLGIAFRDATLDYHMGAWGVLGSVIAGLGVLALAVRRLI